MSEGYIILAMFIYTNQTLPHQCQINQYQKHKQWLHITMVSKLFAQNLLKQHYSHSRYSQY